MAKHGNTEVIPALVPALKKESESELPAPLLSGLVPNGGATVSPILTRSLGTNLDKDVRLQAVESISALLYPRPGYR